MTATAVSARVRLSPQEQALRAMSEAELQEQVIKLARQLGWGTTLSARKALLTQAEAYHIEAPPLDGLIYHPRYSLGSEPGWPDLTLVRAKDRRLIFAELKAERGVVSPRQAEVLDLLRAIASRTSWAIRPAPLDVYVWRPSDLASGAIAEILR